MKILVTGGAGFIGSNLANEFSKEHEVVVLDNLYTGKKENLNKEVKLVEGSVTDYELVEKSTKVDYVFHLAALISNEESIKDPVGTFEVNTEGTFNVLKASLKNKVKKVIFTSSAAVYGDSLELPKKEDMKPEPKTPYAFNKLNSEYLCKTFSQLGLKTCCLRFFNVYGPKQNIDSDYAAVIPIFINNALKNEPLKLEGKGIQTRDFVFVKDVVNACILAMNLEGISNVASGKEVSVRELAEIIKRITNSKSELLDAPARPEDIERSVGDASRIKKEGWKPETSMEEGLKQTIEFFKQALGEADPTNR